MKKHLSISEQINKIDSFFKDSILTSLFINQHKIEYIKQKDRFFYKEINQQDFENILFILNNENTLILNPIFLKYNNFIGISQILNNKIYSPLNGECEISGSFILKNSENSFYFDSTLLKRFQLTEKSINHYSYLIFYKNMNMYLMRRKDRYFIFALLG